MPEKLYLTLLGTPELRWQGQIVPLQQTKLLALLAFLALSPDPVRREDLAALLWEPGKTSLTGIMERYTELLMTVYGPGEGQRHGYPGHQEIELALLRLYRATGEHSYLEFARYFLNQRGQQPYFFDQEARERGDDPADFWAGTYEYMQAHEPVREQDKVVGHAVRATYMYAAMADLAAEDDDQALRVACERLWEDLTRHSLYLIGGLGPSAQNEGMTQPYDLPNASAYAETCAAVGLVFWGRRMAALTGEARYADVMERALYNNVLSGVSLEGDRFFYENPLASEGHHQRWAWHACPCCPPNVARLLASLGEYIYSLSADEVTVNLYVSGQLQAEVGGQPITLSQESEYPWDGRITLSIGTSVPSEFSLRLRLPGWCPEATVTLNGQTVEREPLAVTQAQGYLTVRRVWQSSDTLHLTLSMPAERIYARPEVSHDAGLVAVQRGPVVYCAEGVDQQGDLTRLSLPRGAEMKTRHLPELLGGVTVIEAAARQDSETDWGTDLYRNRPPQPRAATLTLVPYAVWANRGPSPMRVWLRESVG
ncbi:glycoside hydrolase family 127 protein [Deinococcus sp.]|uniref:glycoside hydrolase family 127 protein n=1 Tax=Deinococcus sp. TaxID=47478 RepID=UPI003CC6B12E